MLASLRLTLSQRPLSIGTYQTLVVLNPTLHITSLQIVDLVLHCSTAKITLSLIFSKLPSTQRSSHGGIAPLFCEKHSLSDLSLTEKSFHNGWGGRNTPRSQVWNTTGSFRLGGIAYHLWHINSDKLQISISQAAIPSDNRASYFLSSDHFTHYLHCRDQTFTEANKTFHFAQ